MSSSVAEHKAKVPLDLKFAFITISTSRFTAIQTGNAIQNPSGDIAKVLLEEAGYSLVYSTIIPDDENIIKTIVEKVVNMPHINIVITSGGTGVTKTDLTIETISPLLEKDLPGFGELFRKLSYEIIGSAAMITRTTAGLIKDKAIFCLPGSPQAVETALKTLIIPEAGHIVKHTAE